MHIEFSFTVVCIPPEGADDSIAAAYVSAQQDRYVLKKVSRRHQLGRRRALSISVPLSSSEDSLVKVGSKNIRPGRRCDRNFALTQRLLADMRS